MAKAQDRYLFLNTPPTTPPAADMTYLYVDSDGKLKGMDSNENVSEYVIKNSDSGIDSDGAFNIINRSKHGVFSRATNMASVSSFRIAIDPVPDGFNDQPWGFILNIVGTNSGGGGGNSYRGQFLIAKGYSSSSWGSTAIIGSSSWTITLSNQGNGTVDVAISGGHAGNDNLDNWWISSVGVQKDVTVTVTEL